MRMNIMLGMSPQNKMSVGGMLKSTQEKMQRKEERDSKVAFYENRISMLKNNESDTLEGISRKLDLFHTYKGEIAAAKQEYNNQQMFHAMDEARERGEKIAKEVEDRKPKTAKERREDMVDEALGRDDNKGMLSEILEEIEDMTEELSDMTEDLTDMAEDLSDMAEDLTDMTEIPEEDLSDMAEELREEDYKPIDLFV